MDNLLIFGWEGMHGFYYLFGPKYLSTKEEPDGFYPLPNFDTGYDIIKRSHEKNLLGKLDFRISPSLKEKAPEEKLKELKEMVNCQAIS